jgi:hypothetical protein
MNLRINLKYFCGLPHEMRNHGALFETRYYPEAHQQFPKRGDGRTAGAGLH